MKTTIKPITLVALFLAVTLCLGAVPLALQAFSAEGTGVFSTSKAYAATEDLTAGSVDAQATSTTKKSTKPAKKLRKAFKTAASDFSIDLFQRCVADKGSKENVTISPVSVMNALAVTTNGAAGETSKQMRNVLADGMTKKELNQVLSWYNGKLVNSKKAKLRNANAIWYHNDNTIQMKKKFLKTAKKYYDAEITGADFSDPQTVTDINGWVADKTNNMIKQVISQLDPSDRIAIVNALYFDAKWMEPFDPASVHEATFTTANGKKRTVDMMYNREYTYLEGEGVVGFSKPYAKGYRYVALLPDEGVSTQEFVASLTGESFQNLLKSATNQPVDIAMPKQSLTYSNEGMEKQLASMGMESAFAEDADFSKMATLTDGNLYLGQVIHKTKVEVDENGTKAAAVTAVIMKCSSAYMEDVKSVVLDRPFVYAIVDNTMNLPIFIGTVNTIGK